MSAKKEIRVGLIGHQFMGVAHSNSYRNAQIWYDLPCKVVMKSVCAKETKENLKAFAEKFGWESYETDWEKLVARDDIDLISVATPGFLHKDMVLKAAEYGKHILCEKPLANSLADARIMLDAVQTANVRHCCGYSYRSTPAQALAKQFVDEGKVGRIFHVFARYAQDWIVDPNFAMVWRFDKKLAGSGSLGDICAHAIDAARFITGLEFKEVAGNLKIMIHERPIQSDQPDGKKGRVTVDDVAQFICNFENGTTGCFEASRLATGRKNHNCIEINGDKGSLYWDFEEQNYLYYYDNTRPIGERGFTKINATHDSHPYGGGPWPQGHGIGYADTFVIEIANFLSAIANDTEFHPDFVDGVKCQEVLDAVERSAVEKKWINIG
ncbi:Gfo/Idh/MocA family protein [Candidatus Latescibacterota bacterium]